MDEGRAGRDESVARSPRGERTGPARPSHEASRARRGQAWVQLLMRSSSARAQQDCPPGPGGPRAAGGARSAARARGPPRSLADGRQVGASLHNPRSETQGRRRARAESASVRKEGEPELEKNVERTGPRPFLLLHGGGGAREAALPRAPSRDTLDNDELQQSAPRAESSNVRRRSPGCAPQTATQALEPLSSEPVSSAAHCIPSRGRSFASHCRRQSSRSPS